MLKAWGRQLMGRRFKAGWLTHLLELEEALASLVFPRAALLRLHIFFNNNPESSSLEIKDSSFITYF